MDEIKDYYPLEQKVPDHMSLVNFLVSRYKEQQPLKDVTVLLFQHQMADQVLMARALIELGLSPKRL